MKVNHKSTTNEVNRLFKPRDLSVNKILLVILFLHVLAISFIILAQLRRSDNEGSKISSAKFERESPAPVARPILISPPSRQPDATKFERDSTGPEAQPININAPGQQAVTSTVIYRIKDGDTLGKIAASFGIERSALLSANRLSEGQPIYIGENLQIPQDAPQVADFHEIPSRGESTDNNADLTESKVYREITPKVSDSEDIIVFKQPVVFEGGEVFLKIKDIKTVRSTSDKTVRKDAFPLGESSDPDKKEEKAPITENVVSLFISIESRNNALLEELLTTSPDLDVTDMDGRTPLTLATKTLDWKAVNLLIDHGANPLLPDKDGWSALFHSISTGNSEICHQIAARVNELKSNPSNRDAAVASLNAALLLAAYLDREGAVEVLLNCNAEINTKTTTNETPLMIASKRGNLSVVKTLLRGGASLELIDIQGKTALTHASLGGHTDVVEALEIHQLIPANNLPITADIPLIKPVDFELSLEKQKFTEHIVGIWDPSDGNSLKLPYPYHRFGRVLIPQTLPAGENELLVHDPVAPGNQIVVIIPPIITNENGDRIFAGGNRNFRLGGSAPDDQILPPTDVEDTALPRY